MAMARPGRREKRFRQAPVYVEKAAAVGTY
jgi:hypothetical protein